jgi:hypothetical protein
LQTDCRILRLEPNNRQTEAGIIWKWFRLGSGGVLITSRAAGLFQIRKLVARHQSAFCD